MSDDFDKPKEGAFQPASFNVPSAPENSIPEPPSMMPSFSQPDETSVLNDVPPPITEEMKQSDPLNDLKIDDVSKTSVDVPPNNYSSMEQGASVPEAVKQPSSYAPPSDSTSVADDRRSSFKPASFSQGSGRSETTSSKKTKQKSSGGVKSIFSKIFSILSNKNVPDEAYDSGMIDGSVPFTPAVTYDVFEKSFVTALNDGTNRDMSEKIQLLNETLFEHVVIPAVKLAMAQSGAAISETFQQNQEDANAEPNDVADGKPLELVVPDLETSKVFYGDVLMQELSELIHPALEVAAEYGGQALSRGQTLFKEDERQVSVSTPSYAATTAVVPPAEKVTADPMSHKLPSPDELSNQTIDPSLGETRPFDRQTFNSPPASTTTSGAGALPPHLAAQMGKTAA